MIELDSIPHSWAAKEMISSIVVWTFELPSTSPKTRLASDRSISTEDKDAYASNLIKEPLSSLMFPFILVANRSMISAEIGI